MGKQNINDRAIQEAVSRVRRGEALGIDSKLSDFDAKNMPRVRGQALSQYRVAVGLTLETVASQYVNLFSIDTFVPFVTSVRHGIKGGTAAEIDYLRTVNFMACNPLRLKKLLITGSSAKVIADSEIAVVRRTPFGSSEAERTALASLVGPNAQQTDRVEVPLECELDGATFLRLYVQQYGTPAAGENPEVPDDQQLSVVCFFDQIAERRAAL